MKYLIILLFALSVISAQETGQNIELPDFVITGKDKIDIPPKDKVKPDLQAKLELDFYQPEYKPSQLNLGDHDFSSGFKETIGGLKNPFGGTAELSLGTVSLPSALLNAWYNPEQFMLKAGLSALDEKASNDFRGVNNLSADLKADYYISDSSSFLPGTKIFTSLDYKREKSELLFTKKNFRNIDNANLLLGIEGTGSTLNYAASVSDEIFELDENNTGENLFRVSGNAEMKIQNFSVYFTGNYLNRKYESDSTESFRIGWIETSAGVKLRIADNLLISGGLIYAHAPSNDLFMPQFSIRMKLLKGLTLSGEFLPQSGYMTFSDFYKLNRFINENQRAGVFYKVQNHSKAFITYQYETYYEFSGGLGWRSFNGLPFLTDNDSDGKYEIEFADDPEDLYAFITADFYGGPYGRFFSGVKMSSMTLPSDKDLPNSPKVEIKAAYSFDFDFGLSVGTSLEYFGKSYSDRGNKLEIPSYFDLSFNASWSPFPDFYFLGAINNISDSKNYKFLTVREKPLDLSAGIKYVW